MSDSKACGHFPSKFVKLVDPEGGPSWQKCSDEVKTWMIMWSIWFDPEEATFVENELVVPALPVSVKDRKETEIIRRKAYHCLRVAVFEAHHHLINGSDCPFKAWHALKEAFFTSAAWESVKAIAELCNTKYNPSAKNIRLHISNFENLYIRLEQLGQKIVPTVKFGFLANSVRLAPSLRWVEDKYGSFNSDAIDYKTVKDEYISAEARIVAVAASIPPSIPSPEIAAALNNKVWCKICKTATHQTAQCFSLTNGNNKQNVKKFANSKRMEEGSAHKLTLLKKQSPTTLSSSLISHTTGWSTLLELENLAR